MIRDEQQKANTNRTEAPASLVRRAILDPIQSLSMRLQVGMILSEYRPELTTATILAAMTTAPRIVAAAPEDFVANFNMSPDSSVTSVRATPIATCLTYRTISGGPASGVTIEAENSVTGEKLTVSPSSRKSGERSTISGPSNTVNAAGEPARHEKVTYRTNTTPSISDDEERITTCGAGRTYTMPEPPATPVIPATSTPRPAPPTPVTPDTPTPKPAPTETPEPLATLMARAQERQDKLNADTDATNAKIQATAAANATLQAISDQGELHRKEAKATTSALTDDIKEKQENTRREIENFGSMFQTGQRWIRDTIYDYQIPIIVGAVGSLAYFTLVRPRRLPGSITEGLIVATSGAVAATALRVGFRWLTGY